MTTRINILAIATLAFGLSFSTVATAQIRFQSNFELAVDCDRPLAVRNFGVHGDASGVINADKTLSVDLQIKHILAATIRFDGRLGRTISGPGGTTGQANIVGRNRLRLSWNLPNNQLVVNIAISGQSCTARLDAPLKPGFREYSLYDGSFYSYCSRLRVTSTSCRVS
jgi:hypothetical protein